MCGQCQPQWLTCPFSSWSRSPLVTSTSLPPHADKKKSLLTHPDRVQQGPGVEIRRKQATIEFQAVADAFYTLSDPGRRAAYDRMRGSSSSSSAGSSAGAGAGGGGGWFGGGSAKSSAAPGGFDFFATSDDEEQPDAEGLFGNVFEDMLRPEVQRTVPFWTWTGAAAGAALGFIAGNLPGAAIGGLAGNRLGAVRDAKGKAVYEVFKELGADQKAEILRGLAAKVFSAGIGAMGSK